MKNVRLPLVIVICSAALTAGSLAAQQARPGNAPVNSEAAATLHQNMRKLWTDHVVWTRDYIIAAVACVLLFVYLVYALLRPEQF